MQNETSDRPKRGRAIWLIAGLCLVVWQAGQAVMLGVLGLPGVYTIALPGGAGSGAGVGQAERVTVVPKDAYRKRVEPEAADKPLPKDGREPVPGVRPGAAPEPSLSLPPQAALKRWLRSQAQEFVGGVDSDGNILYRFDIRLEVPDDLRPKVVEVAYDYGAPSARPRSQASKTAQDGFLVKFGAQSCAGVLKVTVTFEDGRTQEVEADGCSLLK
ncbi:MAG: hypothetical protein MI824_09815 [Hyphomicrobiales bacterium]|nr:hypothetical protein [Hyphomicrobiales bacterium]